MAAKRTAKRSAKKPAKKASASNARAKTPAKARATKRATKKAAAKPTARASPPASGGEVARIVGKHVREDGWRGATLARLRDLILEADPDMEEEVKWRKPSNPDGVPVWSHAGIVCTGGVFKDKVKLTFARGAALRDPARVLNASLDAGTWRALDLREGDALDEDAFKDLVRQAVALNLMEKGA